jgi:hypothetical protein
MLENKLHKIIVAHPDDEILFFNSIIPSAKEIILCYGPTSSEEVSAGREKLKSTYPFENVRFLDVPESDVYDKASFKNRKMLREGISVRKNSLAYAARFDTLVAKLRLELALGDVIFTHNPWGEYGHPEHVQVFRAVHSLKAEFNLKIFVDGYVSDKTYGFMSKHYSLLSPQSFLGYPNNDLGQKVMEVYLRSDCWTWRKDYRWPSTEVFYKLADDNETTSAMPNNSSYPPLNMLTRKFTHGTLKSFFTHGLWLLKSMVLKKF